MDTLGQPLEPISSMSAYAALLATAVGLICVPAYVLYERSRSLADLPGPPNPSLLVGNVVDLRRAPTRTRWNVWQDQYGSTYRMAGPFLEPILVLGDPRGATHVLTNNVANYPRPELDRIVLGQWFGPSVFTADGAEHRAMRKTLSPAFTLQSVSNLAPTFVDLAEKMVSTWKDCVEEAGTALTLDVRDDLNAFSLDAISLTMFAYKVTAPPPGQPSIAQILEAFSSSEPPSDGAALAGALVGSFPQLLRLPNPLKRAASTLRNELGRIARVVWAGGPGERAGEARILDMMEKRGGDMTEDQAIAQIVGLLFAGSGTVANMLGEALLELARQPDLQDRLRAELKHTAAGASGTLPGFDVLMSAERLPLLDAVLRESLRVNAVLMDISRVAVSDDEIPLAFPLPDGRTSVRVRAGQEIAIPVRDGLNANPAIWGADAGAFRPERWLAKNAGDRRDLIHAQGNTLSFGDGPRVCLGRTFATAEFKILIAALVSAFIFEPADGVELDFYHLGGNTVRPKVRGREHEGVRLPLKIRAVS